jgi:membrane-associated phospholipid phosphatase
MRLARPAAVLVALCVTASPARAADEPPVPLTYDWAVDGVVTGAFAASTLTLMLLRDDLGPLQCKWCTPGSVDGDVARSVAWANPKAASTLSDVLQVALPLGALAYGVVEGYRLGQPSAGWSGALLVVESVSIAMLVNTAVKYAVGRARPYVWMGTPDLYGNPHDANLSFFSGHVTFAFATAVSAGTVFMMQKLPGAPIVLGVGLGVAAFTSYLRMAAEQHYLTDVLAGAAIGSLVGWAVPVLFHPPRKGAPQPGALMPTPAGIAIAW